MRWISNNCSIGSKFSPLADPNKYQAAFDLFRLSDEYLSFESAFVYASNEEFDLYLDGKIIKHSRNTAQETKLEAYDRLTKETHEIESLLDGTKYLDIINKSIKIKDDSFSYELSQFHVKAGLEIYDSIFSSRFNFPLDWDLPKYSLANFVEVYKLLFIYSITHMHARMMASRRGCIGLGYKNALIIISEEGLVGKIRKHSTIPIDAIKNILNDLTFGSGGIKNPDIAIQPLYKTNCNIYYISPNIVMNSNIERNLSVLLNKFKETRKNYSELSKHRESISRAKIIKTLSEQNFRFWDGEIKSWGPSSDVDLAIISDEEKVCLVLELKSFIEPAEPREIIEKSEEIKKGVDQIASRMESYQINCEEFNQKLKIDKEYKIGWCVGSENSIGLNKVQSKTIPVIRINHLLAKIKKVKSLNDIMKWLENKEYLPIDGIDYRVIPLESSVGSWKLEWHGIVGISNDFINK